MHLNRLVLDGQWTLRNLNGEHQCTMPILGDNFSALLDAELIPDPYYSENEALVRWVGETDWEITREFTVSSESVDSKYAFLNLSRVDTQAEVYINERLVQVCSNAFTRYRPEVSSALKLGNNTIRIVFKRIDSIALANARSLPYPVPFSAGDNNTVPHMNTVRKPQCHAGWDWGITLMVSGIYNSLSLEFVEGARLDYVTHTQTHNDTSVALDICAHLHVYRAGRQTLEIEIDGDMIRVEEHLEPGEQVIRYRKQIQNPKLWWPVGFGEPNLYPLTVRLSDGQSITQRIGLRQLSVDNSLDGIGKRLTVQVNGVDIFCKGANWIPSDALISRQTEQKHRRLLEDAVMANMNMIRVWGGGQYEYDHFYELCDELGLLVWQDAMFACSQYPSVDWFLDQVGAELKHQVLRLSHHTSIALWCGDNEIIGSLEWYDESKNDPTKYAVNYDRINNFVNQTIAKYDPTRTFWPSSPCNGPMDFGGWHDDTSGDMHFWDVWHHGKSFDAYYDVRPRFCSEFGFQSFSSLPSANEFLPDNEYNITAPSMEHHQKNNRGNSIITEMFTRLFRMPNSFENQLYLSQVQQAMAMGIGIEYWRSTRPVCMGTLYWQLNDNWPVASWSSIEYNGRWKQLHYHARRSYSPVMVTAYVKEGSLQFWAVNDQNHDAVISCTGGVYDLNGELIIELPQSTEIKAGSADCFVSIDQSHWQEQARERFVLVRYEAQCNGQTYQGERLVFLTEPKRVALPQSAINVDCSQAANGDFEVRLTTQAPQFYVTLEVEGDTGLFSDNSIKLIPSEARVLTFTPRDGITLNDFKQQLRIYNLADATMG